MSTAVVEFREPLRFILADLDRVQQSYTNDALDAGVRGSVRMGSVDGLILTHCRRAVTTASGAELTPNQFALLCLRTAEIFVASNPDGYRYRTRALEERFDGWTSLLETLRTRVYELLAGDAFLSWQDWHSFVAGNDGINRRLLETEITGNPTRRTEPWPL